MSTLNTKILSTEELLNTYVEVLDELKRRGVVRTRNNPAADYAEWLVASRMKLSLMPNSMPGYDAVSESGLRFQIKCRRLDLSNKSRRLGAIRNLSTKQFDFLIAVLFDKYFQVRAAYQIPHSQITHFARYSEHQNGHILHLRGELLTAEGVIDITDQLAVDRQQTDIES